MTATTTQAAGAVLIRALVANDLDTVRELLAPDVAFSALLPPRIITLDRRDEVVELFAGWFPVDGIDELQVLECCTVVDRHRVGYRVLWHDQAGDHFVFEQQAYYDLGPAGITWMHLVCSGHREVVAPHCGTMSAE